MFRTVVAALDLQPGGDRALPVVRALSELGDVNVELITVSSPSTLGEVAEDGLRRRARANGWAAASCTILHADRVAEAIVDHIRGRDDVLLVMATSAKYPLVGHFLGSVSERVLRAIESPVLLVGPHVPLTFGWVRPTPIVAVDATDTAETAVPSLAAWMRTFPSAAPRIVEVLPTAASGVKSINDADSAHVRHLASRLEAQHIHASSHVLHGGDPSVWLDDFADHLTDPLFVMTSKRWTDSRPHWHSATRDLVQRSVRPVLVVPVRMARHDTVADAPARSTGGPTPLMT